MRSRIEIRVSPADRQLLEELAAVTGLSLSEYLRSCGLQQKMKPLPRLPEVNIKTYAALGRVQGSVYQIAAALGKQQISADGANKRIAEALPKLYALIQDTRRQITNPPQLNDDEPAE